MTLTKNGVLTNGIKSGLLCFVLSTLGVLVAALFAKWFCLSDAVVGIASVVLSAVAVFVGTLLSVKECKFLPKALVGAAVYVVCNTLVCLVAGGGFSFARIGIDALVAFAAATIVALLKSKR